MTSFPSMTTPATGPVVSRRALLAAVPAVALGIRAQPALAEPSLASVVPDHLDLTQTFAITRSGRVTLEDLAARFDNTPDAALQLARWGYVDGYERVFECDDAIGDDASLVSLLYLQFADNTSGDLADAARLLAAGRAQGTRLQFVIPEQIPTPRAGDRSRNSLVRPIPGLKLPTMDQRTSLTGDAMRC